MDDDCKSHSAGRFRIESGDLEGSEEVRILLYSHKYFDVYILPTQCLITSRHYENCWWGVGKGGGGLKYGDNVLLRKI